MNINEYVVSGTSLECTFGTKESTLNVVVPKALIINDKYVATQTDCLPLLNIGSFGMCLANPDRVRECNPSGCWINVSNELTVDGVPALTRKSKMICTTACGEISIVDNAAKKEMHNEKMAKKFDEYGIDRNYKKRYEFEQGVRDCYLKSIEIQSDEMGCLNGCKNKGQFSFMVRSLKEDKDELEKGIIELRKDIIDWIQENGELQIDNNLYEEIKVMPVSEFMKTAELANKENLKMMYSRIFDNIRENYIRLDYAVNPLYDCDGRIYGGGDCVSILSHREGYGYTIIEVGDRGSWVCAVKDESKGAEDIAFYDGEFEEVYKKLMKHF